MTRPAASSIEKVIGKVFAEYDTGEQLDGQNHHPTAGKEPERHSKDIEQLQIQEDQAQDMVAATGQDGQNAIVERERKVQNHVYQQLVLRPGLPLWLVNLPLPSNSRPYLGVLKHWFPLIRPSGGRLTSHEL